MATHSSVLAWRIPGTGKPGGLSSMGSHRVGHDSSDLAVADFIAKGKKSCIWKVDFNRVYRTDKGNQSEYSLEGLMLKLHYFGHLM